MKNAPIIALVQDDFMYQTIVQKLLQASKLFSTVLVFDNGLVAINYIQEHSTPTQLPDIVLLDMGMPVMDGWTFLKEYQKISPILSKQSAIFIHTASLFEEDLQKAKHYSCVAGSIPTPLRINELQKQLHLNPVYT